MTWGQSNRRRALPDHEGRPERISAQLAQKGARSTSYKHMPRDRAARIVIKGTGLDDLTGRGIAIETVPRDFAKDNEND